MAIDTVTCYKDAQMALAQSERRVGELVSALTDATHKLRRWQEVVVTDVDVLFPADVSLFGTVINGGEFPSARELAEALSEYHTLRTAVMDSYRRIPGRLRAILDDPASHPGSAG